MPSMNRAIWSRLVEVSRPLFSSRIRWRALAGLGLLVALLLSLNGLNVINSYVGRGFMTAIAEREAERYRTFALFYLGVFAASTVVAVSYQFVQDRLALLWRRWLTSYLVERYLSGQTYYRINTLAEIDNPDQRIAEDVRTFTSTLLSFFLVILNSTITTIAFAGVLWTITPWLLVMAVGYALFGTLMTILIGHRLAWLNNLQLKKEADLRYGLVHVREYAEPIAVSHAEQREAGQIRRRLGEVVDNLKAVIAVNRNLGFFTSGYSYLVPFLPVLVVAPRYMRGEIEFGVVTQSAMAFAQLLGAFSVIVVQFQNISSFAAVVGRVGSLFEAIQETKTPPGRALQRVESSNKVGYDKLSLRTPKEGHVLIKELSLEIPRGQSLLIVGSNSAAKAALFRATAGFWEAGEGKILRPPADQLLFLPRHPFFVAGSLRDQLRRGTTRRLYTDDQLMAALHAVQLDALVERMGGLDVECDWCNSVPAAEQQLLAMAHLLLVNPPFAFLEHATSALAWRQAKQIYETLSSTSITCISIGERDVLLQYHHVVLELQDAGRWTFSTARRAESA